MLYSRRLHHTRAAWRRLPQPRCGHSNRMRRSIAVPDPLLPSIPSRGRRPGTRLHSPSASINCDHHRLVVSSPPCLFHPCPSTDAFTFVPLNRYTPSGCWRTSTPARFGAAVVATLASWCGPPILTFPRCASHPLTPLLP
jgi:hypothetical protein